MRALAKAIGTVVLVLFGILASGAAMAQYHGHGHRHVHGGGVRFGISLGFPVYAPGFYPAPYYAYPAPVYAYPPLVLRPASPPVYVEQGPAQALPAPPQAQGDWYYCAAAKAYYPYVGECPAGWERVPAQPPAR